MTRWSAQAVAAAAPDAPSLAAARRLATPGPWSETGSTEALVWGKCQGSGSTPYQVSIDLAGPTYRCSCPSRKLPCKHSLALLLLWVQGLDTLGLGGAVDQAAGWASRAAGEAQREASASKPVDLEAQARRRVERTALMDSGIEELRLWLTDLVRVGLALARRQPAGWWDTAAARLVDAQLPGLAEQVREMGSQVHGREDWADHLLAGIGRWWATTAAWQRRESLSVSLQADLRTAVGWALPTADVRRDDALADTWLVLGAHRSDDGRLVQQRTWLWGETSHETVQVLDFAARAQPLPVARIVGSVLDATVARYPGSGPRRALFATEPVVAGRGGGLPASPLVAGSVEELLGRAAEVATANPWAVRVPGVVRGARLAPASGGALAQVVDAEGASLPLAPDADPWLLLARSGGEPASVFGELEAGRFRPLSAATGGTVEGA